MIMMIPFHIVAVHRNVSVYFLLYGIKYIMVDGLGIKKEGNIRVDMMMVTMIFLVGRLDIVKGKLLKKQ